MKDQFSRIELKHIHQAVIRFSDVGFPEGFGHSSTYDVIIEGKRYPPKTIIAYANEFASGTKPLNNFSGGKGTECFNTLEKLGLSIEEKVEPRSRYLIKSSFLERWPLSSLQKLRIEDYSNHKNESFCYWIEHETNVLGGVRGGSAFKFGIFRTGQSTKTGTYGNYIYDGEYAWHSKYGQTRNQAFENIKSLILKTATLSTEGRFKEIDSIDLGDVIKWKIAFLYSDFKVVNIFKHSALISSAEYLGYDQSDYSYPALNEFIISKNREQDFFEFTDLLWKVFDNKGELRDLFEVWLNSTQDNKSGKNQSYLRAIDIIENEFGIPIYTEDDIENLQELYDDLKLHQKDTNGKYFYIRAQSYGRNGFYSAAVACYIDFLKEDPAKSKEEHELINLFQVFGNTIVSEFYNLVSDVLKELNVYQGDDRVHYTVREKRKRLGLTIGQKYALIIEIKQNQITFGHFNTTRNSDNWWQSVSSIQDLIDAKSIIVNSANQEFSKTSKSGYKKHSSMTFEKSIFDLDYRKELISKAFNTNQNLPEVNSYYPIELNQILFGPPGTGKTYNTVSEALKIVDLDFYRNNSDDRESLKERFKQLTINSSNESIGQIGFTTFHQSFSYEDFVEGIKPMNPNETDSLQYHIEEGIFKRICRLAKDSLNAVEDGTSDLINLQQTDFDKAHFYKMSLGNTQNQDDSEVYDYCIENNCIGIGFGNSIDFTDKDERQIKEIGYKEGLGRYDVQAMNLFCNYLKVGNYVVISNGNLYVRAIGRVTGEYKFKENSPFPNNNSWNHFRQVEWIVTDKNIPAKEIYNKNLSQQSIYKLEKKEIKEEFFVKESTQNIIDIPKNPKNFVLIIDEINRGNVSSIFGELITLIEKDKREGMEEEISVILPYSKSEFRVPKNLYIIGTMNTADRSIEALDTALRRRFAFKEMPPKPNLIRETGRLSDTNGFISDLDVSEILRVINDRIEKLIDKDHKIGHSYFLGISDESDLRAVFRDKVIPLLEEYFFGDFGKVNLILGSSFISKSKQSEVTFARNHEYDSAIADDLLEKSVYEIMPEENWDFKSIYQ